jgi:CRISPR-associated protein Cas2
VISFDIHDDRVRYQAVRILRGYAVRVQKSVFEAADLPRAAYLRMRSNLEGVVEPATDSLRYYVLCGACVPRIEHFGTAPGLLDAPAPFEIV